jgi:hypothetical protein
MSHLLSSVDPVLYCDTNGPTHVPTVLSLASSAASVFASSLGPLRIVHCIILLHRAMHSLSVHYCSSCVVVRFIIMRLLRALILSILASNATDPANYHQWVNHESSMTISRCQFSIVHYESIVNQL